MNQEIKKIIKSVAENWSYESEYDFQVDTFCFYCGKYQENGKEEKHKKSCLSLKARKILESL